MSVIVVLCILHSWKLHGDLQICAIWESDYGKVILALAGGGFAVQCSFLVVVVRGWQRCLLHRRVTLCYFLGDALKKSHPFCRCYRCFKCCHIHFSIFDLTVSEFYLLAGYGRWYPCFQSFSAYTAVCYDYSLLLGEYSAINSCKLDMQRLSQLCNASTNQGHLVLASRVSVPAKVDRHCCA